jgi:PAS domain S-box-containing protein
MVTQPGSGGGTTSEEAAQGSALAENVYLRAALSAVPAYILTLDRELRITHVNRYLPGLTPANILGRHYVDFCRPEQRELASEALHDVLNGAEQRVYESRSIEGFGSMLFRVTIKPMRVDGSLVGLTIVAEDVTRQREMEARMMRSDLLANLGTLVAGVAHEVNNPLTYVLGNLEYLLLDPGRQPERRIKEALEGAQRIRAAVADLLSLVRGRQEIEAESVVVADVVQRALRVVRREIGTRGRLEVQVDPTLTVRGTADRIGQVLLNLLINAAHAIDEGQPALHRVGVHASVIPEGFVRLSVSDSGRGIERGLIGSIFDPFVTTKAPGEGTGLGLYVCHSIVQGLGGRIWVDSEVGKGSTFHVDLPMGAPSRVASEAPHAAPTPFPEPLDLNVLVVEDEPSIRAFARQVLGADHAAVAGTVHEALELIETCDFDLVVCDVGLPDASGLDLLAGVEAKKKHPAFLFTTGGPVGGRTMARLQQSSWPLLTKPFTAAELLGAVRSLLERTRG